MVAQLPRLQRSRGAGPTTRARAIGRSRISVRLLGLCTGQDKRAEQRVSWCWSHTVYTIGLRAGPIPGAENPGGGESELVAGLRVAGRVRGPRRPRLAEVGSVPTVRGRWRRRRSCTDRRNLRYRGSVPVYNLQRPSAREAVRSRPVPAQLRSVLSPSPGARAARFPRGRRRAAPAAGRSSRSGTARWHARTPRGRRNRVRRSRTPAPGRRT